MAGPSEIRKFDPLIDGEYDSVVKVLQRMIEARKGWVNFEPDVLDDQEIPPTGGIFSNKGPAVSFCTWTAPSVSRKGVVSPQSIGVQHAVGGRARPKLSERKLEVPDGWRVKVDHPKRGMVVEVPTDADPARVLDWLLAAGEAVAMVPVTGRWHAAIYLG